MASHYPTHTSLVYGNRSEKPQTLIAGVRVRSERTLDTVVSDKHDHPCDFNRKGREGGGIEVCET